MAEDLNNSPNGERKVIPLAMRFNEGKPKLSFIPLSLMEDCSRVFTYGAAKYERDNWKKGDYFNSIMDSTLRHLGKIQEGEYVDEESGLPHLGHVMCNIIFLTNTCKNHLNLVDVPGLQEAIENYGMESHDR